MAVPREYQHFISLFEQSESFQFLSTPAVAAASLHASLGQPLGCLNPTLLC